MPSQKLQETAGSSTFPRARGSHLLVAGFVAMSLSVMAGWLVIAGANAPGDNVSVPMIRATAISCRLLILFGPFQNADAILDTDDRAA